MNDTEQGHGASGAAPKGAVDEQSAAQAVRRMFDEIAPRYDLANHLLSLNVDRLWWWRTARYFRNALNSRDAEVLDLCCGTGDMAIALRKQAPAGARPYFGADFSHQMLLRGAVKFQSRGILPVEADALRLPFVNGKFRLVVSAFGVRNLANYDMGLLEIYRVLQSGGEVGILDFSEPGGILGKFYSFYFRRILPTIGTMVSGVRGPYEYLPSSVGSFPEPPQMLEKLQAAGFREVSWTPYTFGIAGLYRGTKP